MSKKIKNQAKAEVAENVNVVANETVETTVQQPQELDPVAQAKKEAQELMERAKEAARKAKEAAAEAKKAAEAAKALTSRPKRKVTWVAKLLTADCSAENSPVEKSDVHYVAEKAAIDFLVTSRENGVTTNWVELYKRNKETDEEILVETLRLVDGVITIE